MLKKMFVLLLTCITLNGCASQGGLVQTSAVIDGQAFTIVAHEQRLPDLFLSQNKLKFNFLVKENGVDQRQFNAVANAELLCRDYTKTVRPSNWIIAGTGATIYALAGIVLGPVAEAAFDGVSARDYSVYGGGAGAANGAANGVTMFGGQTYPFEDCGGAIFEQLPDLNVRVLRKSPY